MKLIVLSVILSCCLVYVYSDCGAAEVSTVQQQFQAAFGSDEGRLNEYGEAAFRRTAAEHPELVPQGSPEALARRAQFIMRRLSAGIQLLSNPDELAARLEQMAAEPAPSRNPALYRAHLQSLLAVLPDFMGADYDAAAFRSCITMLAQRLMQAMQS